MVGVPTGAGRLAGETVAGHRRDDDIERVLGIAAVAVGSVSGPMILSCSITEPGQPWVMITAFRPKAIRVLM